MEKNVCFTITETGESAYGQLFSITTKSKNFQSLNQQNVSKPLMFRKMKQISEQISETTDYGVVFDIG